MGHGGHESCTYTSKLRSRFQCTPQLISTYLSPGTLIAYTSMLVIQASDSEPQWEDAGLADGRVPLLSSESVARWPTPAKQISDIFYICRPTHLPQKVNPPSTLQPCTGRQWLIKLFLNSCATSSASLGLFPYMLAGGGRCTWGKSFRGGECLPTCFGRPCLTHYFSKPAASRFDWTVR